MSVYVLGVATHAPFFRENQRRLEEMIYYTTRAALDAANVARKQIDTLVTGACDELDARPISSMLLSAPAGGYELDEIKVTDSGASALCLAYSRVLSGESEAALVSSWCKSSKTDVEAVMRFRGDPFYTRPLGIGRLVSDGLFAQAVAQEFGITDREVVQRVRQAYARAARNQRGMGYPVPSLEEVNESPYEATPLRATHRAPLTDGAVALVVASEKFLKLNRDCEPLARIVGVGWATDSYRLDARRLRDMNSARSAWQRALKAAGLRTACDLDVLELESQTGYHEAAYVRAFGITDESGLSPSGGAFAQNPLFCTGLINAAEAVLQVAGKAGAVQRLRVRRAAAHSCHGFAQQGNVVVVFEAPSAVQ